MPVTSSAKVSESPSRYQEKRMPKLGIQSYPPEIGWPPRLVWTSHARWIEDRRRRQREHPAPRCASEPCIAKAPAPPPGKAAQRASNVSGWRARPHSASRFRSRRRPLRPPSSIRDNGSNRQPTSSCGLFCRLWSHSLESEFASIRLDVASADPAGDEVAVLCGVVPDLAPAIANRLLLLPVRLA